MYRIQVYKVVDGKQKKVVELEQDNIDLGRLINAANGQPLSDDDIARLANKLKGLPGDVETRG